MHICSKALYPTQGIREWLIKDSDCRTLPLTDGLAQLLVDRAREATTRGLCQNLLQNCCGGEFRPPARKNCEV